ncbi:MAG TPA: helix-turn-helix domain-containing protein [Marmoricola sp.]|nr:helix-turn-helix domain-containing protein [Marmoricola sp.]
MAVRKRDGDRVDPRVLRAIAHPVRNRVLSELSAVGPMRAADVAGRIGIPANQASFHLRQLAKYGLVEEAPELARDRRDRVWRVREESTTLHLDGLEETPGGKAAVSVFRRQMAERAHALVDSAYADTKVEGTSVTVIEDSVSLTKDEAVELAEALAELTKRWHDRTKGREQSGRRTYHLLQLLQPFPEEAAGTPEDAD